MPKGARETIALGVKNNARKTTAAETSEAGTPRPAQSAEGASMDRATAHRGWRGGSSDPVDGGDTSVSTFALQPPCSRPAASETSGAPAPNPRTPHPGTPLPGAAPAPPSVPQRKDARQLTRMLFKATSRPSAESPGLLQTGRRGDKASLSRTPPSSGPLSPSTPALAFKPTQRGAGPPAGRMRRTGLAEVAGGGVGGSRAPKRVQRSKGVEGR